MTEFLRLTNWDSHQHYKNNSTPPWVKLHNKLLDNYDWRSLDDGQKLVAIGLILIASRTGNKIPNDVKYIKETLHVRKRPDLDAFIKSGYLEPYENAQGENSKPIEPKNSRVDIEQTYKEPMPDQIRSDQSRGEESIEEGDTNADPDISDLLALPAGNIPDGVIGIGGFTSVDSIKALSMSEAVRVCAGFETAHDAKSSIRMWTDRAMKLAASMGHDRSLDLITDHLVAIWKSQQPNANSKDIGAFKNPAAYLNAVTLEALRGGKVLTP